jgi:hypothetical protein
MTIWPITAFPNGMFSISGADDLFRRAPGKSISDHDPDVENDCRLPMGSHPMLDPLYGSSNLEVKHNGAGYPRLDKVRALMDWDVALRDLRVCFSYDRMPGGQLNCGKCNKCAHTMLEILTAGGDFSKVASFPQQEFTPEWVRDSVTVRDRLDEQYLLDLIDPLCAIGRGDLAGVLRKKLSWYRRLLASAGNRKTVRAVIRRLR